MFRRAGVVLALLVIPMFAGIKGPTRKVNELTIDGGYYGGGSWSVSTPYLEASNGYLAYDAAGKSEAVTFQREKGPGIKWSLVEVSSFETYEPQGMRGGYFVTELQKGYTMKIRAEEGPFAGWYLGRSGGKLVLVEKRHHAARLKMVVETTEYKGR